MSKKRSLEGQPIVLAKALTLHVDGSINKREGKAACAVVMTDSHGRQTTITEKATSKTSTKVEEEAICLAFRQIKTIRPSSATILTDCQNSVDLYERVLEQRVKRESRFTKTLRNDLAYCTKEGISVTIAKVDRSENRLADRAARMAADLPSRAAVQQERKRRKKARKNLRRISL